MSTMSDRTQPTHIQVHPTVEVHHRFQGGGGFFSERGLSTPQLIAVLTGVPVGGTLLALAGLTLFGTMVGMAIAVPLFVLFSPVLVPAAMVIGLAVAGFLTSGACALTALSSFSWVMNYIRQTQGTVPEQLDSAKRRVADMAGMVGQKTKEVGQDIQNKAHEVKTRS